MLSKVSFCAMPRVGLGAGFLSAAALRNPPIAARVHAAPVSFRKSLRFCAMVVLLLSRIPCIFQGPAGGRLYCKLLAAATQVAVRTDGQTQSQGRSARMRAISF